jgi:hypothetical protein
MGQVDLLQRKDNYRLYAKLGWGHILIIEGKNKVFFLPTYP